MVSKFELPSTKTVISTAASVAATAMLVRSFANDFIPHELRQYALTKFHHFFATFTNEITLVIDEFDGLVKNQLYGAAEIYLGTISSPSSKTFRASIPFILERSKAVKDGKKTLKLHTLKIDGVRCPTMNPWQAVNLDHPATFEIVIWASGDWEIQLDFSNGKLFEF